MVELAVQLLVAPTYYNKLILAARGQPFANVVVSLHNTVCSGHQQYCFFIIMKCRMMKAGIYLLIVAKIRLDRYPACHDTLLRNTQSFHFLLEVVSCYIITMNLGMKPSSMEIKVRNNVDQRNRHPCLFQKHG
ncbi:hypothetical protein D3C77_591690 [compost metagenome]